MRPSKRFSLQYHNHREEHWTIVEGVGQINRNIEPTVSGANVSDLSSMMVAMLLLNELPASLVLDKVKTGTGAARVNFTLLKGNYKDLFYTKSIIQKDEARRLYQSKNYFF